MVYFDRGFLRNLLAVFIAGILVFGAYLINFSNLVYATSCEIHNGNQFNCELQTGCTWDPVQSCSEYNGNQSGCQSQNGCSYPGNEGQCSALDEAACNATAGCSVNMLQCEWNGSECLGGSGCSSYYDESSCNSAAYFSSCTGLYDNGSCTGNYSPETCSGTFDADPPVISEVTPVTTPTNDSTPSYTFTTNEAGTILYEGSCSSVSNGASVGNNTITFSSLSDGSYADCIINVSDVSGNTSSDLEVSLFTIDTVVPSQPGPPDMTSGTDSGSSSSDNITNDSTPNFTMSCESGATVYLKESNTVLGTGSCSSSSVTTTSSTLSGGVHSIIATQVDQAGNISATSSALSITIDTTAPTISEVTAVSAGTDTTPDYTFTTDEAGTITYGGSCTSLTTSASSGSNTITLETLALGTYSDCTVIVTDSAGNASNALTLTSFTISSVSSDTSTTSSLNSSGSSRRSISSQSNTTQTNIQINTPKTLGNKVSITTIPKTFLFTKNLSIYMRDGDIINLQKFLNATGFIVSKTGNGSPGREIQRFGPGTRVALAKFQASVGIKPSIGYFGPITQAYINSILKGR